MYKHIFSLKRYFSQSNQVQTAFKYISDNLKSRDWSAYVIGKYLPKQIRQQYQTIAWFNFELNRIAENTKESSLSMGKIEFWKDVINRIYKKEDPTLQPISICLNHACKNHPLTKIHFTRLIQSRSFEINNKSIGTMQQLMSISENSQTPVILLTLELLRIPITDDMIKLAVQVGRAVGICNHLRRIPYTLRNYRLYIPNEITTKHNINIRNIWDRVKGQPRQQLFDAVLEVASFSRESLQRARKLKTILPKQAFRAYLSAVQTELYLENLQKVNFNVFNSSLNKSTVTLPYRLFKTARDGHFLYNK